MQDPIPEEVKRFLDQYINSIAELEIILFLRVHRDQSWSALSVAERIYSSEEVTAGLLTKLTDSGFISADDTSSAPFQYRPRNQELARMLDQLAEVYVKYLIPVSELVHKKSRRNIEGLADAFRFKKEK